MKKIYITLDDLLDTKLSFIMKHNPGALDEILGVGGKDYALRPHDRHIYLKMGYKDRDEWFKAWLKRDNDVLHKSMVSHLLNFLNGMVTEYKLGTEEALGEHEANLFVNTWPYTLTADEKKDIEIEIRKGCPLIDELKFISVGIYDLKPSYIKENFNLVFMGDFHYWCDIHGKTLMKMMCPHTTIIAPRLFHNLETEGKLSPIKEDDKDIEKLFDLDMFKVTEAVYATIIGLYFIHASWFCNVLVPLYDIKETEHDLNRQPDPFVAYTHDNIPFDRQYGPHLE